MRRSHVLSLVDSKSINKKKMDQIKLPIRPSNRCNLFARNLKRITRSNVCFIVSVVIAFVFILCYLLVFERNSPDFSKRKYSIVIDGGSTGTRIHVFGYEVEDKKAVFNFGDSGLASLKVNPGLSAFANDPEAAGESLVKLLEFGKGQIPYEHWGDTEVRLMATAGLRLLELVLQDRILDSCRRVLRTSGFKFRDEWASVITGSDEGVYAWVVANYALGTLGSDPLQTTGIIELGGASAQVTFVSSDPMPPEFSRVVIFRNTTYNLYSHSFLHFGLNVAHGSLKEALISINSNLAIKGTPTDPCTPKGYVHNEVSKLSPDSLGQKTASLSSLQFKGNFSECRSAALMMLQKGKEKCSYQHCSIGSSFIPKLQGNFLATENFFFTSKFFGLGQKTFLTDLVMAGQQYCEEDWTKLKKRYHSSDEEDLLRYCFSSAYIVALLNDSLGIDFNEGRFSPRSNVFRVHSSIYYLLSPSSSRKEKRKRIAVANQVGNIPLDWALGAFIVLSTAKLDLGNPDWIVTVMSEDSPTILSLVAIFLILVFTLWSVSKWRKLELKTIYDLEKGRYIVTRIGRYS